MLKTLKIFWHSLVMATQELKVNKLRTFLSLLGVSIGIFCIISVLTLTFSLEKNVRSEMQALGENVVYIQRFPWGDNGGDWRKYLMRPRAKYEELRDLKQRIHSASDIAYVYDASDKTVAYGKDYMEGVTMHAVTYDFANIQKLEISAGRFFTNEETTGNGMVIILGANIWEGLFGTEERTIDKTVEFAGRQFKVVGAMKKYGESLVGAFDYDNSVLVPYSAARQLVDDRNIWVEPMIMVQAKPGVSVIELRDELEGTMRAIRQLKPGEEDNFSLNELNMVSGDMDKIFGSINLGGWAIGILALVVGAFGIANIMFVTVKERTNIIGLKKAIGAKRGVILSEFLLESMMLCIIGGLMGMAIVFLLTRLIASSVSFKIYMTSSVIILGIVTSAVTGILAGFIPAFSAAKLDPVVAIRS